MIISRLQQMYIYFCKKYNPQNNSIVKEILTLEEFYFFNKMDNYDKIHSFNLFLQVQKNPLLKDDINYLKLTLLHDSAKEHASFWERTKQVIFKKSQISNHSEKAYENLKDINLTLAKLCKLHHDKSNDEKMIEFQKLDDH